MKDEAEAFLEKNPNSTTSKLENETTATVGCFLKYVAVPKDTPLTVAKGTVHRGKHK